MSFHWNLSSSEDEFEETEMIEGSTLPTERTDEMANIAVGKFSRENNVGNGDGSLVGYSNEACLEPMHHSSSEESDSVDWEDVENDSVNPQHPVTIDLNVKPPSRDEAKKRKRKTRRVYSFRMLPNDLKNFLINIRRAHMLTLTSRAIHVSRCCSDTELLHVIHSLLPPHWALRSTAGSSDSDIPSEGQAKEFCNWFFDLVNQAATRREQTLTNNVRAGAPIRANRKRRKGTRNSKKATQKLITEGQGRTNPLHLLNICSYLSMTYNDNPQLWENSSVDPLVTQSDKAQLLVAMIRSLGWRARLVMALNPIKCDLDTDHPLFVNSFKNVFRSVLRPIDLNDATRKEKSNAKASLKQASPTKETQSKERLEERPVTNVGDLDEMNVESSASGVARGELSWVEILCRRSAPSSKGKRKPQFQWIHVDPGRELFNEPKAVESLLGSVQNDGKKRKSGSTISYALAVEHRAFAESMPSAGDNAYVRLTDVTPRYASAWSRTLRHRNVTTTKVSSTESNSNDTWWAESIRQTNRMNRKVVKEVTKRTPVSPVHGKISSRPSGETTLTARLLREESPPGEASLTSRDAHEPIVTIIDDSSDSKMSNTPLPNESSEDDAEHAEREELIESASNEAIPTSKKAFKNHPLYAIPSVLNARQVLAPDSRKRVCGVFKGELVYRRSDVSTAMTAKKWLYQGRKVKSKEMGQPVKRVAARKVVSTGFKALRSYGVGDANDGTELARQRDIEAASVPLNEGNDMEELYGIWQTRPWSPPFVGPDEAIPVNEYNNMELQLLNPGLVHLDEPKMSLVAKKLQVPYAPALLGFEGHGGNRTPTIKGIVVHEHNAEFLREAYAEYQSESIEKEIGKNQHQIRKNWKKLILGILTKDRLEREYGKDQST